MNLKRRISMCFVIAAFVSQLAMAGTPAGWISTQQATFIARERVPKGIPIKAELDTDGGPLRYEIELMTQTILYKVKVNPLNGSVVGISTSGGGGVQQDMNEARQILLNAQMTLQQAMHQAQAVRPNFFLREGDVRYRNGVGVFHIELARGSMQLELDFRASDGVLIHQSLHGLAPGTSFFNLYIGNPPPLFNTSNIIPLQHAIIHNQRQFPGAQIYKIQLSPGIPMRYEVEMLRNGQLVKAKFNASNGNFMSSEIRNDPALKTQVQQSYANVQTPFATAVNNARIAVPTGFVVDAKLRLQETGRWYHVKVQNKSGYVLVQVDAINGSVVKMYYTNN